MVGFFGAFACSRFCVVRGDARPLLLFPWNTDIRDLSTTLCQGFTRRVLATVPLRARLNGHPVVAGLPVPTDDLIPVAGVTS